ncbi:ADP-ribosylglycohydrolase family protein [Hyphomicrobiaceae bacterium 22]|uniref:ADP-ribosylglycohydrolase family protein n=2 Tax=Prosthecodimorpha staleyi TaxID=2840188 RepID=A0A947DAZ0_9HYPH|nr:ADP-ribosylglycohydrolase family protein [Prosthecodimorpha staleyi]
MVELGTAPGPAVAAVGAARPDATPTTAQVAHVAGTAPADEPVPDRGLDARRNRAVGALLGLAVGDAVGTTLEFKRRDDRAPRLTDMVGGGPFGLKPGEWTDDTAMALALAESLRAHPTLDERDLMNRFVNWYRHGAHSCTGTCFDIGNTVRGALDRFGRTGNPVAGETHAHAAGNGSLMRLAPVAVRHWHDRERRRDVAARQSRTTHGAAEAVDACVVYADLLAEAIAGRPRSAVMRPRSEPYAGRIGPIAAGSWRGKPRAQVRGSGYVADALEAALWCVGRTADFRGAVLMAANLREDADTTAAIAGQLAGALYGAAGIPPAWRAAVAWGKTIESLAADLFDAGATEAPGPV